MILVDDGSNDGSENICDKFAQADKRVKVAHKNRKGTTGVSAARNTGLGMATGEYVVFLDADDWLDNNIIEKAVKNFQEETLNYWGCNVHIARGKTEKQNMNIPSLSRADLIANTINII